jgi:hypothetical protein
MKTAILSLFLIINIFSATYAGEKRKLSMSVFADETTCWKCMKSINSITKAKLKNYKLEVTLYFCSESSELLSKIVKQNELNCKALLDPECLYAKKYKKITSIPGIVIKDVAKDSVIIETNWDNPKEYLKTITNYDKNYKINSKSENIILSDPIIIKEKNGAPINIHYCNIAYNSKMNRYYGFIRDDEKTISALDSNGFIIEEIDLKNYKEIEEFWAQGSPEFMNDSIFVWRSSSKKRGGEQVMYGLNINSKKIEKKGVIDTNQSTDNSSVYEYKVVPNANKLVFTKYYFKHSILNRNEKLLLMTDTNYNNDKYFGRIDPVCETTTLAGHFMTFPVTPESVDSNIYYLMSLSRNLYVFDLDGNYRKTIELDFEKDYNPPLVNIPEKISRNEHNDLWAKYKILANIFVRNDKIIVVGLNVVSNKETLKTESVYYITVFDKNGKRIINTTQLPRNIKNGRQMSDDRLLLIEPGSDGSKMIRWLDINTISN